jgi:hypothetical protein
MSKQVVKVALSDYPWSPVDEALLAYLRDRRSV